MKVTQENLEAAHDECPTIDIRNELSPGAEYWTGRGEPDEEGYYNGPYPILASWPNGRGAICYGGDSNWGDWVTDSDSDSRELLLDDVDDDGGPIRYDEEGQLVP